MHVTDPHLWVNRSELFFRCEHQNRSERLSLAPWILPRITRMKTDPRTNSIYQSTTRRTLPRCRRLNNIARTQHVKALALKATAASLIHRKRLTMDQIPLPELQQFAITRRPRLSRLQRRAFGFADLDHLFCMRAGQLAAARQSTALADSSEILAHLLLRFLHFNVCRSCIISGL